jgi:hypothetical protein
MALGDFIARLTGRKQEVPEPAPVPRPPTTDDLLASLTRVEQLVADGAVPAVVASRVARVVRVVRETIPRLGNLGGSLDAYNVMATATDYLPEAIGGYLRLPRQWADTRPVDRGKTSLMILIDQLDLLAATMDKVFDAVNRADAAALIAHGRFLQEKFGTGSTGGGLAIGPTASTPPPDTGPLQPPPGRGGA